MSVTTIREEELRCMKGEEGLVLQGCGGDLDEWVTGINDMLTEEGILLEGTRINDCKSFTHDNLTCLLFPFKDAKLDIGKFAIWRLKTHSQFGGMWLSDYVPNRLGGFLEETPIHKEKPDCIEGREQDLHPAYPLCRVSAKIRQIHRCIRRLGKCAFRQSRAKTV